MEYKTIKFLKGNNINYRKIILERVPKSAKDIQELFGSKLSQILKTILFIGEKEPILLVLSGDKKVNITQIKKITGQKNIRIAKINEVKDLTGYEVSGIGPFGLQSNLKKIIDYNVFNEEIVTIGSGNPIIGLEIKSSDLKNIWDGLFGNFSF